MGLLNASAAHVSIRAHAARAPRNAFARVCKQGVERTNAFNYLQAMQLLSSGVAHATRLGADAVVVWRIDTRLLNPLDVDALQPWAHPHKIFVPRLQAGGGVYDRFLVSDLTTARASTRYRYDSMLALLNSTANHTCAYGERLMLRAVLALNLSVGYTRTRIVRVRADLSVPDVDRAHVLREIQPRGWMRGMNRYADELNCTADGCVIRSPYSDKSV